MRVEIMEELENEGIFGILPNEMRDKIFSSIEDDFTYSVACKVNHRWRRESEVVWKEFARFRGFLEDESFWLQHNKDWKWIVRCKKNILNSASLKEGINSIGVLDKPFSWKYEGELLGSKRDGVGICVFIKGDKYMGQWKNDEYHGKGSYYYVSNGCTYSGEWSQGVKTGYGECVWKEGDHYAGTWKENMQEGEGVHTWPAGEKYQGTWKSAKQEGYGIFSWPNGDCFEGQWKDDLRHGRAAYSYANGGKYEGEYFLDERSGRGVFYWPDGDRYEGTWLNGGRQGPGVLITRDGVLHYQEWSESVGVNYSKELPAKFPCESLEED